MSRLKKQLSNKFNLILFLIFLLAVIFLPKGGLQGDYEYYIRWIDWMRESGLANIYAMQEVNYFPIFLYILYFLSVVIRDLVVLAANIYLVKIFILAFDFAAIFLVGNLLKKLNKSPFLSFLILFNPAFFFNSLLWGQIEALYIFFIAAAFLAVIYKHTNLSVFCYVLAFYSKLQAIIFLPGLVLLLLPFYLRNRKLLLQTFGVAVATNVVLLLPFVLNGSLNQMYANVFSSIDMFAVLSNNAFNFWILFLGPFEAGSPDSAKLLFLSFKQWGMLLFALSSFIILLPLLIRLLKKEKIAQKLAAGFISLVFLINGLISLVFFFFNTQMHERYLQPTILFFWISLILKPSKLLAVIYGLTSVAFVLNLERVIKYFNLGIYDTILFSSRISALMFLVALILGLYYVIKNYLLYHRAVKSG